MLPMLFLHKLHEATRRLDPARIAVVALVLAVHVAGLLLLQAAMHVPQPLQDDQRPFVVTLDFFTPQQPEPATPAIPETPPVAASPMPRRAPAAQITALPSKPKPTSTAAMFLDEHPVPGTEDVARSGKSDVFDAPTEHKPFPNAPQLSSNLPTPSAIRLPDRPSMLQAYWAVPEGENLKGRIVRKVPLVGLLLAATGGIGQPHCPLKSEHPDCLERLVEGLSP